MAYKPANPNGQATMANSEPVVIASNQSAVAVSQSSQPLPTGAATLAEQQTQTASLSVLDDWDETDRAKVNLIVGQAGVAANSGVASATTQRVVLATDTTVPNVTGNVAHDAVDSGNPVKTGGQARTTNPTAVADADRANFITDKLGKQIVVGSIRDLKGETTTTITSSTTETTIVAAGGAGVFRDVYGLVITNSSATATLVTIRDVTAAGTPMYFMAPAGQTTGFMLPEGAAKKQGTANSTWSAQCGTSVASVYINALWVANT